MDILEGTHGKLRELALFAGAGGGILGSLLLGWKTVCAVEINPYCQRVLCERQNDGTLDPFPIWDDIRTFDGKPWKELVEVVSGGFPCQDISSANPKAKGIVGERSGLWKEMARIIGEVRPRFAFVENSPMLVSRGLDIILMDLAAMGYDARWGVFSACREGAPHTRERLFIVAHTHCIDEKRIEELHSIASEKRWGKSLEVGLRIKSKGGPWSSEPGVDRVVDGVAHRSYRIEALGNGQVPEVVVRAWNELTGR